MILILEGVVILDGRSKGLEFAFRQNVGLRKSPLRSNLSGFAVSLVFGVWDLRGEQSRPLVVVPRVNVVDVVR